MSAAPPATTDPRRLRRRATAMLVIVVVGLVISGLTAFPLRWEVELLGRIFNVPEGGPAGDGLGSWIALVREGLRTTYREYPFIAYGTDWLAFAHLILAVLFAGAIRDPVRNRWIITFGLIAAAAVVPTALVCGHFRGIPLAWRLIDCSFGVLAFAPLWLARRAVLGLERIADVPAAPR